MKLLFATGNKGKLKEIRAMLRETGIEVVGLSDLPEKYEVEESGSTFEENAKIKALELFKRTGLPTLADDSGLAVEALGGRPGVRSARYAGENATDEENYLKLLSEMKDVPEGERGAAFVCAMSLIGPDGREAKASGRMTGAIGFSPRGADGFGYDPVFLLPELGKTLAEVELDYKNQISHRAKALKLMLPEILRVFDRA